MANFTDGVAMVLPWAGGLVPATLTYQNLQTAGLEWWQAAVVAGVVEGMGFVAVTTVIDVYEHNRSEQATVKAITWNTGSGSVLNGAFWIAIGGTVLYLVAVLVINMALDPAASGAKVATGGLLSTFGVLGGVMVALRNQLGQRREERARQNQIHLDREQADREFTQKVKLEKLHLEQEFKLKKLEESFRKVSAKAEKVAETLQAGQEVAETFHEHAETFRKWQDWRKVPESERKVIAKLETAEQVSAIYGGALKTCQNWLMNAKKEFAEVAA